MKPLRLLVLLVTLPLLLGGCGVEEPVDGGKSKEEITAPEPKSEEAKVNAPTDSLADNIVGKLMTLVHLKFEGNVAQIQFNGDGRMGVMHGDGGGLKDQRLTYKIEGNEVLVFQDGERDGGISFSSSSPKAGDQVEWGPKGGKKRSKIRKIEAAPQTAVNSSTEKQQKLKGFK